MIRRCLRALIAATLVTSPAQIVAAGGEWSLFLDYTFSAESDAVTDGDRTKARRVADYLASNPTLRIGLDGLNQGRVASVRDALLRAGVPALKIEVGPFSAPHLRGERRVLVMICR